VAASKPEAFLAGVEIANLYNKPEDFVFPSERLQGSKPLDLASVLKKKIQPAFRRIGITGVGWHTFRHPVGSMLAEMGEHQLTIRDYLRHCNLRVTNKYLQAHRRPQAWHRTNWSTLFCRQVFCRRQTQSNERCLEPFSDGTILARRLSSPNIPLICWTLGWQVLEKNGGDDGTRTRGLCRDRAAF
jgi:hypothetical protein